MKAKMALLRDELLATKAKIVMLAEHAKQTGKRLQATMEKEGKDQLKTEQGTISKLTRVITVYPEVVETKIKRIKEAAETRGQVEYKSSTFLAVRLKKEE